jgi:hypothetical protein
MRCLSYTILLPLRFQSVEIFQVTSNQFDRKQAAFPASPFLAANPHSDVCDITTNFNYLLSSLQVDAELCRQISAYLRANLS